MCLATFVWCLHTDRRLICLDVVSGQQIAFHLSEDGDQHFAHAQHAIVDGGASISMPRSRFSMAHCR